MADRETLYPPTAEHKWSAFQHKKKHNLWTATGGGSSPPFLWLVHFNSLKSDLDKRRKARNEGETGIKGIRYCDLFFADDVITAMSHPRREPLQEEAWKESGDFEEVLAEKGLGRTREKSANFPHSASGNRGQVLPARTQCPQGPCNGKKEAREGKSEPAGNNQRRRRSG